MCVAIYKPKKSVVQYEDMLACHETNPDGMGFTVVERGKLLTHKQMDNFPAFFKLLNRYQDQQMMVHFRISTHGKINRACCHPHLLANKSIAFVHNGILSKYTPNGKSKVSDTIIFKKTMLEPLIKKYPNAIFEDQYLIKLLGEAIGSGNKLVLLDRKGNHSIINEFSGSAKRENGVWFSNSNWEYSDFGSISDWNYSSWEDKPVKFTGYTYRDAMRPDPVILDNICNHCEEAFKPNYTTMRDVCEECEELIFETEASLFD